jgi:hypothetical protein
LRPQLHIFTKEIVLLFKRLFNDEIDPKVKGYYTEWNKGRHLKVRKV